ncbi:MAG: S-adenosylmethionine:tRNA ribosyltransferase-isomerase, partial [Moorea sp. SIO3C2]|nr:S-adenosylmethionine:tRNA ribosyltransferase-isomerase [Moorena sp. SIO3C2]
LLLVEAFLGRKRLEEVYQYALQHGFRFLSYGDGMLITI